MKKTLDEISHNFVSNNCVGGRLFQVLNERYVNPFIWTIMMPDDYLFLVENWDSIDLKNIAIDRGIVTARNADRYYWTIDGKVKLIAYHYVKDLDYPEATKIGSDLHIADIEKHMVAKYLERLSRMESMPPTFVFTGFSLPQFDVSDLQIKKFLSIKTPYTRILLTTDDNWLRFNTHENRIIIKTITGSGLNNAKLILETLSPQSLENA